MPAYRLLLPHVQVLLPRAKPNVTWETTEPHYIAYLPKTVAYDFHAISSLFHLAFCIRAFAPFELSAPITITHYAGPAGVHSIKHSYYFKPIGISVTGPALFSLLFKGSGRMAPLVSCTGFEPVFCDP